MATTTKEYTGNGSNYINGATTAQCDFTFPYLKQTDVKVSLNGTTLETTKYTFPSSTSIQFTSGTETTTQEANGAPKTGVTILIYRDTDVNFAKAVYASGSSIRAFDLNNNKDQSLFFEQEVGDTANPKNFVTSAQISDGTSLSAADKTKLDTIEANAKDDQTSTEIKSLYESNSDTNAFTDAEKTKLQSVEANAKDDQTASEILNLLSDQNIVTTGRLQAGTANGTDSIFNSNLRIENTFPTFYLNDTDTNNDFYIRNGNGVFNIHDVQANVNRFTINSSGTAAFSGNLEVGAQLSVNGLTSGSDLIISDISPNLTFTDSNADANNKTWHFKCSSNNEFQIQAINDSAGGGGGLFKFTRTGSNIDTFEGQKSANTWFTVDNVNRKVTTRDLDVTNNITVTGTIDGRDLATDGTKLDGIEANAINASNAAITNKLPLTGGTMTGDLILSSSVPKLRFVDTDGTASYRLINNSGAFKVQDTSDSNATRFSIFSTGHVAVEKNLTVNENLTVQGNIIVNGTSTTLNTATVNVDDKNFVLMSIDSPTDDLAHNGGFTLRGDTDKTFQWKNGTDSWTSSEHIHLIDTKRLYLGDSRDLEIYHNGTQSVINNQLGNFLIQQAASTSFLFLESDTRIVLNGLNDATNPMAKFIKDGAVELYYDGVKKFHTRSNGVEVTGNTFIRADSSTDGILLIYADNGDDHDDLWRLKATDSGSNFHIDNYASSSWETTIKAVGNAQTELYYDNSKKFETTSTGITASGVGSVIKASAGSVSPDSNSVLNLENSDHCILQLHSPANKSNRIMFGDPSDNKAGQIKYTHSNNALAFKTNSVDDRLILDSSGNLQIPNDTGKLQLGASQDLEINHDGTYNIIKSNNGHNIEFKIGSNTVIKAGGGGEAQLLYTGSKKLETNVDGVQVTGSTGAFLEIRSSGAYDAGLVLTANNNDSTDWSIRNDESASNLLDFRFNGTQKASLNSSGTFSVTGGITTSGDSYFNEDVFFDGATGGRDVRWDRASNSLRFYDNAVLSIGSGQDLRIWHDGARTNIVENGTGNLGISGNGSVKFDIIQSTYGTDYIARFKNANCELYASATKRLETTSTGATVTTSSAANSIRNITTSTSAPSGGSDGDLWFTYVA